MRAHRGRGLLASIPDRGVLDSLVNVWASGSSIFVENCSSSSLVFEIADVKDDLGDTLECDPCWSQGSVKQRQVVELAHIAEDGRWTIRRAGAAFARCALRVRMPDDGASSKSEEWSISMVLKTCASQMCALPHS
ncbi:unnamed protein product, partial [Prorocentrum cordatum]